MKSLNRKAEAIFRTIIFKTHEGQLKLDKHPGIFMSLVVEKIGTAVMGKTPGNIWSFAHYFEMNGDLCQDPEMTFFECAEMIIPLSFTMAGSALARHEDSVRIEDGKLVGYYPKKHRQHVEFANQWLRNIEDQQEIKQDGVRFPIFTPPTSPVSTTSETPTPTPPATVNIVDYSDKAVAVFGDTKPFKDQLKGLGGRFNRFLKYEGNTVPGWIFSKNRHIDLKKLLGQ